MSTAVESTSQVVRSAPPWVSIRSDTTQSTGNGPGTAGRDFDGWELFGTSPAEVSNLNRKDNLLENPVPGKYFLKVTDIDFKAATRPKNWAIFVPTPNLIDELNKELTA